MIDSTAFPVCPTHPDVSVLLAVYNGERYLEQALNSITSQTLRNIEIIIVDDCSTDSTPQILARMADADARIRILRAPQNLRLAKALNFGLEHARARYIARMDDDDISLPNRLEIQKRYLDSHPDVTLLGTSFDWIDAEGRLLRSSIRSRDSFAIRWALRFSPNLSHPTFMFRPSLRDGTPVRYDAEIPLAQDYELLCRLSRADAGVVCLPDVLLQYRVHDQAVSRARRPEQAAFARQLAFRFQQEELPADVVSAMEPLRDCFFDAAPATPARIAGCFAGARAVLRHDIAAEPDRTAWLRRQTAQLLSWILRRSGASSRQILLAFLRHGPDLLPALALRAVETRAWCPAMLQSDPDVWHLSQTKDKSA